MSFWCKIELCYLTYTLLAPKKKKEKKTPNPQKPQQTKKGIELHHTYTVLSLSEQTPIAMARDWAYHVVILT